MSSASVKSIDFELPLDSLDMYESGTEDLEDAIITNLDQDLTPTGGKADASSNNSFSFRFREDLAEAATLSLSTTATVSAQWKGMNSPREEDVDGGTTITVQVQPRRTRNLSEADMILQPSQVEDLLDQNSPVEICNSKSVECQHEMTPRGVGLPSSFSPPQTLSSPLLPRRVSWWDGLRTCLHPVVSLLKKDKKQIIKQEDCEIPIADIRELEFIGSGSQGAVFAGDYLGEKVAVKKVKDVTYCQEAVHMRKLSHANIVKFKYVFPCIVY